MGGPMVRPWWLVVLSGACSTAVEVLRVAVVSEFTGPASPNSAKFINGFTNFSVPFINTAGIPATDTWTIEVVDYDTQSNAAAAQAAITAAIGAGQDLQGNAVGEIHAIVAATSSSNGVIKSIGEDLGIVNLHTSGGNPVTWSDAQPFAFGMHLPFTTYTRGPIRMAAIRGLKTIGIIRSFAHGFSRASCIAALEWSRAAGLRVVGPSVAWCRANSAMTGQCRLVGSGAQERCVCGEQADVDGFGYKYNIEEVPTFYELDENKIGNGLVLGEVDDGTTDFARGIFQDMKDQESGETPDVILNFAWETHNVLNAMYLENFVPKMVFGWQGGTEPSWAKDLTGNLTETHGLWAVGFGQWHSAMTFSDPLFGSNANAVELFGSQMGKFLDYDTAGGVAVGSLLYKVMMSYVPANFKDESLTSKRDLLRRGVGMMNDETMWGLIRFNRNNQNSGRDTAAWQILPEADGIKQRCVLPSEAAEVELQVPFPTWESRFGCSAGFYNTMQQCLPCPEGHFKAVGDSGVVVTTCDTCALGLGTEPGASGMTQCSPCAKGSSHEDGSGVCTMCRPGLFRSTDSVATPEDTKCQSCTFGEFSNAVGATVCRACPAGSFMDDRGATVCVHCAAGSIAAETGRSTCELCTVGTFAASSGLTGCQQCSAGMTTVQSVKMAGSEKMVYLQGASGEEACACDEGSFRSEAGECQACPEGMYCPIGADIRNLQYASASDGPSGSFSRPYPVNIPGSWTSRAEPLSVFHCRSVNNCPGGPPESCGPNLGGRSCERCDDEYRWAGDHCVKCSNLELSSWLFPVLPALAAPLVILGMYRMFGDGVEKWESWQNSGSALLFVALNHYQIANLVVSCNVALPRNYANVLESFTWTNDILGILKPECAGLASFSESLIAKALLPVVLLLVVLVLKVLFWWLARAINRGLALESNRLFNVFMSLMFTFFNAVVSMSLVLFKCSENPNGLSTLSADQAIVCWDSEEWRDVLVVGILSVIVYIIGVGGVFTWAIIMAPRGSTFTDPGFQMRWKFLFIKFRSTVHWWSTCFLMKNFALNLGLVIFTAGVQQMYWIMTVIITYTVLCMMWMPYRVRIANYAELSSGVSLMYLTSMVSWFAEREDGKFDVPISEASSTLVFMPLVTALGMFCYVLYMAQHSKGQRRKDLQLELIKQQLPMFTTVLREDPEIAQQFLAGLGDWDRYFMLSAAQVVACELTGSKIGSRLISSKIPDKVKSLSEMASSSASKEGQAAAPQPTKGSAGHKVSDNEASAEVDVDDDPFFI